MVHMKGYMYKWIMQDLGEKAIIYSQARQPFRNLQMLQRVSNSAVSKTCTEGGEIVICSSVRRGISDFSCVISSLQDH